jgi:hypothetical protein
MEITVGASLEPRAPVRSPVLRIPAEALSETCRRDWRQAKLVSQGHAFDVDIKKYE